MVLFIPALSAMQSHTIDLPSPATSIETEVLDDMSDSIALPYESSLVACGMADLGGS